jgi:hypothetical protein
MEALVFLRSKGASRRADLQCMYVPFASRLDSALRGPSVLLSQARPHPQAAEIEGERTVSGRRRGSA